jgi:hypothetical protein
VPTKRALPKNVPIKDTRRRLIEGDRTIRVILKKKIAAQESTRRESTRCVLHKRQRVRHAVQEKGPLTLRERPKSREETPKEGDGNKRGLSRYRTATTYTASHKTQVLLT